MELRGGAESPLKPEADSFELQRSRVLLLGRFEGNHVGEVGGVERDADRGADAWFLRLDQFPCASVQPHIVATPLGLTSELCR